MKTTRFYTSLKKVASDAELVSIFSYSVDKTRNFFEILLHSEPTDVIKARCERHKFSVTENKRYICQDGKQAMQAVWEIRPTRDSDIEFIGKDSTFISVNPNVIIATDDVMIQSGLSSATTERGKTLTLWVYHEGVNPFSIRARKRKMWRPIMDVFEKPLAEDSEEDGRLKLKSTHRIEGFYGAPVNGKMDSRRYLAENGVSVEPII